MSAPIRRLARDLAIYGWGELLLRAGSFLALPLFTRALNPGDYGVWSFILTLTGLFTTILALGGDSAFSLFFLEARSDEDRQRLTSTWFIFLASWSLAIMFLLLPWVGLLSHWSLGTSKHAVLFILALLATPLTLINMLCSQVLRNQFQPGGFVTLNSLTTALSLGSSVIGAVILKWGLLGIVSGPLVAAIVMLPLRIHSIRDLLRPMFSRSLLRDFLKYALPFVPTALAYWIFAASDRLMLAKLSTLEQVGLYAVAINVTSILNLVNTAIGQAWGPFAIRINEESPELASRFFGRAMTYLLAGFGALCVGVTTLAPEIVRLVTTQRYHASAIAIGPLALAVMASASTQVTALGMSLTKETMHFATYSWGVAILNVALNLWAIPHWGMLGTSSVMAVCYGVLTICYLHQSQKLLPVQYEVRRSLTIIGLTLLFTVGSQYLPLYALPFDLALKAAYVLAFMSSLFVVRAFDAREWEGLRSLLALAPLKA